MQRLLLCALIVTLPAQAQAACRQSDLTGTWQAYFSILPQKAPYAVHCKLEINSTGTISNTSCDALPVFLTEFELTGGKLKLATNYRCSFKGSFKLDGELQRLDNATMALDKNTILGSGWSDSAAITFTMARIQ